ncbi:MAG: hypothetical protein H6719_30355 [Sandaracinaceae bacterium]|nr:hypothetical protein [Sandaracinaceae bacterium]
MSEASPQLPEAEGQAADPPVAPSEKLAVELPAGVASETVVEGDAEPEAAQTVVDSASETSIESSPPGSGPDRGRYRMIERQGERIIISGNAPNIELHIERGLTVDEAGRKRFGPQTIYLDGVFGGAPFCDNETRQYSLDHHAGCVRGFTLATCEQAVVMLLSGLPLSSGTWTVWVNDPDLDAMLAAWVLINHVELLRDDRKHLRTAMPVIRLEGVIDAHGTDRDLLTGLPSDALAAAQASVDRLIANERRHKSSRTWMTTDWIEYACSQLAEFDAHFLPEEALDALLEIQESGRAPLHNGRIAVLLESTLGIYAVEERLKERYGADLGVIALQIDKERYTLRLVDAFLPKNLEAVYKELNRLDPRARTRGSNPNVWGGSGDIGGSPRDTGTGLTGEEILGVLSDVLGPPVPWWKRLLARITQLVTGKPKRPMLPP